MPLSLAPSPIKVLPVYARQSIPGAIDDCYVREGVYRRLVKAARALPGDYGLLVLDGWRPWRVQQYLFNTLQEAIRSRQPELSEEILFRRTREFVSVPSCEADSPSPHLTGGAVDVTLSDADGLPLDMGTLFDEAVPASHSAALETVTNPDARQRKARDNRRHLYGAMHEQGFTNLPSEWWHYDVGDQLWAHYSEQDQALYGPVELENIETGFLSVSLNPDGSKAG